MLRARVLPIVAVQVSAADGSAAAGSAAAAPALEAQLLRACSAGLDGARCVSAGDLSAGADASSDATRLGVSEAPRAIAVVSWARADHASIEVGFADGEQPLWVSRELEFAASDPPIERWRAVGLTIALLADDPRFWNSPPASPAVEPPLASAEAAGLSDGAPLAEVRALAGAGIVSGAWRWGAALRVGWPISAGFFGTGSVAYALARDTSLDARWFDATLGVGLDAGSIVADLDARFRLELLAENVAVTIRRDGASDRRDAWVPGVSLGADVLWPLGAAWLLSAGADVFWLDGATAIVSAGERVGASAGAGVLLGLGAGRRF